MYIKLKHSKEERKLDTCFFSGEPPCRSSDPVSFSSISGINKTCYCFVHPRFSPKRRTNMVTTWQRMWIKIVDGEWWTQIGIGFQWRGICSDLYLIGDVFRMDLWTFELRWEMDKCVESKQGEKFIRCCWVFMLMSEYVFTWTCVMDCVKLWLKAQAFYSHLPHHSAYPCLHVI